MTLGGSAPDLLANNKQMVTPHAHTHGPVYCQLSVFPQLAFALPLSLCLYLSLCLSISASLPLLPLSPSVNGGCVVIINDNLLVNIIIILIAVNDIDIVDTVRLRPSSVVRHRCPHHIHHHQSSAGRLY
jgi:hypothetical protein